MSRVVPILMYHSVSGDPAPWIAPFTVTPSAFVRQLDAILEAGATTLTVSSFVDALRHGPSMLPERPVLVTFDDGFADLHGTALSELTRRGIASTAYVTTGFVEAGRGPQGDSMLDWPALAELAATGVEIGGHSHTHPQLDTLSRARAVEEVRRCKALLEDHLAEAHRSFAYPHGYSSSGVRRIVRAAGFDSACGAGNAFSHSEDDVFRLARLMVRSTTTDVDVAAWICGERARIVPRREPIRTGAWRLYRRVGVRTGIRQPVDL